jgi:hypothetical protein
MFYLAKYENARMGVAEPEYLVAKGNEAIQEGEALSLASDGTLTKCGATTAPAYIAMCSVSATATERKIPVIPVDKHQLYRVETSAAPTSLKVGAKVTINSDGLKVTATTTDGVATVIDLNGANAAGDEIYVKFI